MIEDAINEVRALLKPFEAGPVEWVRMPMDPTQSTFGLAMVVPLVSSACNPEVLADLISGITGKLLYAVEENSMAGVQITFGKAEGDEIKRCYRIMIPASQIAKALILKKLPETSSYNPNEITGFWFQEFR